MMAEDLLGVNSGKPVDVNTYHVATTLIGGGRFASVYRAYDKKSMADVALKIYLSADERAQPSCHGREGHPKATLGLEHSVLPDVQGCAKGQAQGWMAPGVGHGVGRVRRRTAQATGKRRQTDRSFRLLKSCRRRKELLPNGGLARVLATQTPV